MALETEGYGFARAFWQSSKEVRHLVIRGISDDGSAAKDDRRHTYAADAAAAFARHFILDRPLRESQARRVVRCAMPNRARLRYCVFGGASATTAGTPSRLMLNTRNVKGSDPGLPHWCTRPERS